jgi:hypothetical protein
MGMIYVVNEIRFEQLHIVYELSRDVVMWLEAYFPELNVSPSSMLPVTGYVHPLDPCGIRFRHQPI